MWECPDLFPLWVDGDPAQELWVLKTNVARRGGGLTLCWLGEFDGHTFARRADRPVQLLAPGGVYAEVTYNGVTPDGTALQFGWMPQQPLDGRPWTGAQSVPCTLSARSGPDGPQLCRLPAAAVGALRGVPTRSDRADLGPEPLPLAPDAPAGQALDVEVEFAATGAGRYGLEIPLSDGAARVVCDPRIGEIALETPGGGRMAMACAATREGVRLRVVLDAGLVEVFADGGTASLAVSVDPRHVTGAPSAFADGSSVALTDAAVWPLLP